MGEGGFDSGAGDGFGTFESFGWGSVRWGGGRCSGRDAVGGGAQETGLTLHVSTREVVVDVVATDHHDHPLRDFGAGDFAVFELAAGGRKVPQRVTSVRFLGPGFGGSGETAGMRRWWGFRAARDPGGWMRRAYNMSDENGSVRLATGQHTMHAPYFQGAQRSVALQLFTRRPGGEWKGFDVRDFQAPAEAGAAVGESSR